MPTEKNVLVFVHGWSVTNLNTYGHLPERLQAELLKKNANVIVKDIYLGQYISFHDEVRVQDISRAFNFAVDVQLKDVLADGSRFICITHSTGGPAIRDWWDTYYNSEGLLCPMSHLVMLAPANFGSALAQLGKGKLSRMNSLFLGVEPGQSVLDWLELGSKDSWDLNEKWIKSSGEEIGENGIFPFSIIGQSIDREIYDSINSYTGELGSDGVVRSAAANLNATYVSVTQGAVTRVANGYSIAEAEVTFKKAPQTAFKIVKGKSHSGSEMGIMGSPIAATSGDTAESDDVVSSILRCIDVKSKDEYDTLINDFNTETENNQVDELLESVGLPMFLIRRNFIHDKFSMVIFRIRDSKGYAVTDYDLLFTAGEANNPNHLPVGFFADRQQNSLTPETVTYFINYDIMNSCDAVMDGDNIIRPAIIGIDKLGITVKPRPDVGFVRYHPLDIVAKKEFFDNVITPNGTTLIDICVQRLVSTDVFTLIPEADVTPDKLDFHKIKDKGNLVT